MRGDEPCFVEINVLYAGQRDETTGWQGGLLKISTEKSVLCVKPMKGRQARRHMNNRAKAKNGENNKVKEGCVM